LRQTQDLKVGQDSLQKNRVEDVKLRPLQVIPMRIEPIDPIMFEATQVEVEVPPEIDEATLAEIENVNAEDVDDALNDLDNLLEEEEQERAETRKKWMEEDAKQREEIQKMKEMREKKRKRKESKRTKNDNATKRKRISSN